MRTSPALLLHLTFCVLTCSGWAQAPAKAPPEAAPGAAKSGAPGAAAEKTSTRDAKINVQFEGMSLAEAMEEVQARMPDLNIVVPPALGSTPLGKLKLRNVTIDGLIRAINAATDGIIEGMYDGEDYLTFVTNEGAPVQEQPICRVLSLRDYLAGKKPDEVDRAINDLNEVVAVARERLDRVRSGNRLKAPEFSVHPATKLLIVVGPADAVALVEEVVNAVTSGPRQAGISGMGGGFGGGFPGSGDPNNPAASPGGRSGTVPGAEPAPGARKF